MRYIDEGFRPLYKNFCIFPMNDVIRNALTGENGIDEADGVMVYGYIDHVEGNTLEFVALTKRVDDVKFTFIKLPDDARFFARAENLAEVVYKFADYGDSHLYEQFKAKIDRLSAYDVNENVAKTRTMAFLDEFRYTYSYDDVKVVLYKEGLELEGVWVKIETFDKGIFKGTLMNKPKQDFGVNIGDQIAFIVNEGKDKKKNLIADLTASRKYTKEELEGGKILKGALETFAKEQNQFKFYAILEILKDSKVLIPQNKKGVELLSSKNGTFFPVFSDSIEMWQCEEGIQKIEMTFLEAIKKAKKDKKLSGIVLNAYSDGFVIPKSMYGLIENMD